MKTNEIVKSYAMGLITQDETKNLLREMGYDPYSIGVLITPPFYSAMWAKSSLIISRCEYCTCLKVSNHTHCPSCGAPY